MEENDEYLTKQLITYIGNKRALLPLITDGLNTIQKRLNLGQFSFLDIFSGSGIVSRFLKQYSHTLHVNDLETYSHIINQCYLTNKSDIDWQTLEKYHQEIVWKLNNKPLKQGFITELYAPQNDDRILPGERVFYTRRNAMYLDTAREYIDQIPGNLQPLFLGPLLAQASIHANTGGVFKGFYKNKNGIGQFGGQKENALARIKANMKLEFPILSNFNSQVHIYQQDANTLAKELPDVDVAYLDPPYNQHPYGSNYFMLNLLAKYQRPKNISCVSGIPKDWNRSDYNKRRLAAESLQKLCYDLQAKYLLISFNSEGFISKKEMEAMFHKIGKLTIREQAYPTYRASRNLKERNISVHEYLYILEK